MQKLDPRRALSASAVYRLLVFVIGGRHCRSVYARDHIRAQTGDRVLDIGCGTGDILAHLPNVDYVGFDLSPTYVATAHRDFGSRGRFFCREVGPDAIADLGTFDLVLANGVIHHLDDRQALELFNLAKSVLGPSGRLVTLDGCYQAGQSHIVRYLLSRDRGKYVRTAGEYTRLASQSFENVTASLRTDLLRIPYTHMIMECRQ